MKKKLSIVLIVTFLSILVLPMTLFPFLKKFENVTINENRELADFPKLNNDFGAGFDKYFNDRVPFRKSFIKMYTDMDEGLTKSYKGIMDTMHIPYYMQKGDVLYGEKGWLFYTGEDSLLDYTGLNLPTESELAMYLEKLNKVEGFLKEKGITMNVLVLPNKEQVYSKYMPKAIKVSSDTSRAEKIIDHFKSNSSVSITYPKDVLLEHVDDPIYFKYDTHWNNYGAYLGFAELFKDMGKNPTLPTRLTKKVVNEERDLSNMLGKGKVEDYNWSIAYESAGKSDDSLLIIGDSFRDSMMWYFNLEYATIYNYHHGKTVECLLNGHFDTVDHIVFECVERYEETLFIHVFDILIDYYNL